MRILIFLVFVLFLTGCASQIQIENYNITENYNQTSGNITYSMQFILYNPSSFQKADCKAEIKLSNETKEYILGEVEARQRHKYLVPFNMPNGETQISLTPKCSFK